ncbi:MAG: LPS export ABC transporter permease LptF [Bacteroidota bacterium]
MSVRGLIIDRAFYREAAGTTLAIAVVLLVVMVLMSMTLLLGRAARGDQPVQVVFLLLGFQTLARLDVLLPLAFYFGVLLTLSRWYRDNEMTVLAACGVGLLHFLRPVLRLGLIFTVVVSLWAFYLTPLATRMIENIKSQTASQSEPTLVAPGVFTELAGRNRILYAEKIEPDGKFEGVFVSSLEQGRQGVLVAKSGHPFTDPKTGDKFFALHDGTLYDGEPGMADYRILEFNVYNLRIEPKNVEATPVPTAGLPTLALLRQVADPDVNAELHWRIGKTIALFVLAVYAVVLAYTDVRRGRMSNLFVAIVVYFIYSNLLSIGETMLQKGRVPPLAGLWWVHGGMALVAFYLLRQRARNRSMMTLPAWFRN